MVACSEGEFGIYRCEGGREVGKRGIGRAGLPLRVRGTMGGYYCTIALSRRVLSVEGEHGGSPLRVRGTMRGYYPTIPAGAMGGEMPHRGRPYVYGAGGLL